MQKTAYHLEGNGLVKWFHCRLKDTLLACCADHLPRVICWVCGQLHVKTPLSHPPRPFLVWLFVFLDDCLKSQKWILLISSNKCN